MGLSRNKVAVSEGAAGSPPFYGEWERVPRKSFVFGIGKNDGEIGSCTLILLVVQFLGIVRFSNTPKGV